MADIVHDVLPPRLTGLSDALHLEKVSWRAIWAGLMVTLGMEGLFLSFGLFIGAAFGGSVPWSMIWYFVSMIVSFFAGAWTSARLSDMAVPEMCILHGITTWGLATLATVVIGTWLAPRWVGIVLSTSGKPPAAIIASIVGADSAVAWGGMIWGGVVLSLLGAFFGGAAVRPIQPHTAGREVPPGPSELAA